MLVTAAVKVSDRSRNHTTSVWHTRSECDINPLFIAEGEECSTVKGIHGPVGTNNGRNISFTDARTK